MTAASDLFTPAPISSDVEADHPAQYSPEVLEAIDEVLASNHPLSPRMGLRILDPYAGKGSGVDAWAATGYDAIGVELEPEWGCASPRIVQGSALQLSALDLGGTFDAVITSPCYGNRMADNHEAKDPCKACVPGMSDAPTLDASGGVCKTCGGTGLSSRITYRHKLGRMPSQGSAAVMQWGNAYRHHHSQFVHSAIDVLEPEALIIINMKNHIRDGREQLVSEWWVNTLLVRGCRLLEVRPVRTQGMGFGANADARTDREFLIVVRAPAERTLL